MMQFKPFLGLWTTYRIENGVAITQTRSHRASIPLRNAKLETLDLDWPLGAIRIAAHGEELVWRKFRDRDRVMEALEAERQRAIQQDEPQRVQVNANRAKGDMDKIILAEGLDTGKAIYSITISDDGSKLAAGSEGRVVIWDISVGRLLSTQDSGSYVGALFFNQARHSLVISKYGRASQWRSYDFILNDNPHLLEVDVFLGEKIDDGIDIQFDNISINESVISSNFTKYAHIRDAGREAIRESIHGGSYHDVVDLYDLSDIQMLKTIYISDSELNEIEAKYIKHIYIKRIDQIVFNRDVSKLAILVTLIVGACIEYGYIFMLDLDSGQKIKLGEGYKPTVLDWISYIGLILTSNKLLWEKPKLESKWANFYSWQSLIRQGRSYLAMAFSQDGQILAASRHRNSIELWDINLNRITHTLNIVDHCYLIIDIKFTQDSRRLASIYEDYNNRRIIALWDVQAGELIKTIDVDSCTRLACFSKSGDKIFFGCEDGTIRCWDITAGQELVRLMTFDDGEWMALTPEGEYNASPGTEKYLRVQTPQGIEPIEDHKAKFHKPERIAEILSR